jgi:hypothetical protein
VSEASKLQAAYDALVSRFVLPLVEGGAAELDRPIAPGAFSFFKDTTATSPEVDERIFDALHRAASRFVPIETVPWPTPGLVALAAAAHDLVALTDPALATFFARGARRTILAWTDRWLGLVPGPTTRSEALARHALLEPLLSARRKDTMVSTWMFNYRFSGRAMPWSPDVMPRFLLPQREEKLVPLDALVDELDRDQPTLRPRLDALVSRSPVTELVRAASRPGFRFGLASLAVLSDGTLRGAIARELAASEWSAGPAIVHASFEQLIGRDAMLAGIGARLVVELALTSALDPTRAGLSPSREDEDTARYAAVLPAMLDHPRLIDELRALDDGDRAKLQARAERLHTRVTAVQLDQARMLLDAIKEPLA